MRSFALILTALMLLGSCGMFRQFKEDRTETKRKKAERKEAFAQAQSADGTATEMAPTDPIQMQASDSLLISYERSPCFGRCPVFKIKVYESGFTTYQGVNFVEYMGYFYTRIDAEKLQQIHAAITRSDFFNLEDRYDNEKITDLPSRIYQVDAMGMNKRIIARYEAPEALNTLGQEMEAIFKGIPWTAFTGDH